MAGTSQGLGAVLNVQSTLQKLWQFIETTIRILLLSKWKVTLPKTDNTSCVILGNGPSFKNMLNQHAPFLDGKELACVNHFPTTDFYTTLKPKYYITSAPDLWLEDIDQHFMNQSEKLFEAMVAKTDWDLIMFIPYEARKFQKWQNLIAQNKHITVVYFNNTPVEGWEGFRHWCFKRNWGMPRPHNVMIPSITLTLNMGFNNIFLWGADHSWLSEISVTQDNRVLINQKHFYDHEHSKGKPLDKRGKGERNLPELLTKLVHAFNGYFILETYSRYRKANIRNATPNSLIDAFERIDLN